MRGCVAEIHSSAASKSIKCLWFQAVVVRFDLIGDGA